MSISAISHREAELSSFIAVADKKYIMKDGAPRSIAWSAALRLPQNGDAFHILTLRRIDDSLQAVAERETGDLAQTTREKRAVGRVWSALMQYEPRLQEIPFVPFLCVAATRGFPTNPLCCFETCIHFLLNMCREWVAEFPKPPMKTLNILDGYLEHHSAKGQELWRHLNDGVYECTVKDYAWLPIQTFFLYNFQEPDRMTFLDEIVTRSDGLQYFYTMAVCLVMHNHAALMRAGTREEVHNIMTRPLSSADATKLMQQASRLCLLIPFNVEPATELHVQPGVERRSWFYPMITVGRWPAEVAAEAMISRRRVLQNIEVRENELNRRMKNEMLSLRNAADVTQFNTFVSHTLMADPDVGPLEDVKKAAADLQQRSKENDFVPSTSAPHRSQSPAPHPPAGTVPVGEPHNVPSAEAEVTPFMSQHGGGSDTPIDPQSMPQSQAMSQRSSSKSSSIPENLKLAVAKIAAARVLHERERSRSQGTAPSSNGRGTSTPAVMTGSITSADPTVGPSGTASVLESATTQQNHARFSTHSVGGRGSSIPSTAEVPSIDLSALQPAAQDP